MRLPRFARNDDDTTRTSCRKEEVNSLISTTEITGCVLTAETRRSRRGTQRKTDASFWERHKTRKEKTENTEVAQPLLNMGKEIGFPLRNSAVLSASAVREKVSSVPCLRQRLAVGAQQW
jgi:hypothetical protein